MDMPLIRYSQKKTRAILKSPEISGYCVNSITELWKFFEISKHKYENKYS